MVEVATQTDLLGSLGINWKLFVAQLVNFSVVVFVLWKWVFKPVTSTLDKRQKLIEESLEKAKSIDERMQKIGAETGTILKESHVQAQAIMVSAEEKAKEFHENEMKKTRAQVDSMLASGKAELEAMKAHLLQETRADLSSIVVQAVERILAESADTKTHDVFVAKALAALKTK